MVFLGSMPYVPSYARSLKTPLLSYLRSWTNCLYDKSKGVFYSQRVRHKKLQEKQGRRGKKEKEEKRKKGKNQKEKDGKGGKRKNRKTGKKKGEKQSGKDRESKKKEEQKKRKRKREKSNKENGQRGKRKPKTDEEQHGKNISSPQTYIRRGVSRYKKMREVKTSRIFQTRRKAVLTVLPGFDNQQPPSGTCLPPYSVL